MSTPNIHPEGLNAVTSLYQEQMIRLVNNPFLSDVVFLVGAEGKRYYAHRLLLIHSSDVFRKLFEGRRKQHEAHRRCVIVVENARPAIFLELLYFIYCGTCEVTAKNVMEVLFVATKYEIYDLQKKCESLLSENWGILLRGFVAASLKLNGKMQEICLRMIEAHATEVFEDVEFLKLPGALIIRVIRMKGLKCSDCQLMAAIEKWKSAQKDQEQATRIYRMVMFRVKYGTSPLKTNVKMAQKKLEV